MFQRRAARCVCSNYNREASVTSKLSYIYWHNLHQIRVDVRLVMLCKIIHDILALAISLQLVALCETLSLQSARCYIDPRSY